MSFLQIGKITRTHGLKGEIFVSLFSPSEHIAPLIMNQVIQIYRPGKEKKEKEINKKSCQRACAHKKGLIIKLKGVDTKFEAEALKGAVLSVPQKIFVSLKGENMYLCEVLNFEVYDQKIGTLGTIHGFSSNGAQDLLLVQDEKGIQREIPFIDEFIIHVHFDLKKVQVHLPSNWPYNKYPEKKGTPSVPFLLCANWKMHKTPDSVRDYIHKINNLPDLKHPKQFIFFAPALTLFVLAEEWASSSFGWGAQNCHFEDKGSFTGENSPLVLKEMGATHCLVGHSERRQLFFENEEMIQKKVKSLLNHSIQPIVCVGENIKDRKNNKSFQVVEKQLSGILKNVDNLDRICVAYEPVWAIGTGKVAEVEQIAEMQEHIHQLCKTEGKTLHFLYGGSVNEKNVKELSQIPGVNGFLIGSASLDPLTFFNLAQNLVIKKGRD